jgi:hypothetical protein
MKFITIPAQDAIIYKEKYLTKLDMLIRVGYTYYSDVERGFYVLRFRDTILAPETQEQFDIFINTLNSCGVFYFIKEL